IFGMQFHVALTLGLGYVLERFFAILAHGIMGGVIGIGFSRYIFNKKFISLLIYFLLLQCFIICLLMVL
ncbi:hypothetical protein ABCY77_13085, partial [Thermoanaerobacter uzonensis]